MKNIKECIACVSNHSAQLFAGGCPQDAKPLHDYPAQLCERTVLKPDIGLMAKVAGGLWASTPTSHKCPKGAPLGTEGCTWVDKGLEKIANFSCVNAGLSRAVMAKNTSCFD